MSEVTEFAFTMDQYATLLSTLSAEEYDFVGYDEPGDGEVILRHDVDISPQRALSMARVESELGVSSTYFFLVTSPAYNLLRPRNLYAMRRIESLGHDIGLHFDVHHAWEGRPDPESLVGRVTTEMRILGRLTDGSVDAVSFHVPPEWVLDVSFEEFTNAYAPRYFTDIEYVSDSNQKWRDEHPFAAGIPDTMQILVHPGLWYRHDRSLDEILDALSDSAHRNVEEYLSLLGV